MELIVMHWKFSHLNVSFMKSLDCHTCFLLFFHTCSHSLPFVLCEFLQIFNYVPSITVYEQGWKKHISFGHAKSVEVLYIYTARGYDVTGYLEFWNFGI